MAMNFATTGEDLSGMEQNDCAIWKIDINEINNTLPDRYKDKLKKESPYLFTVEMLDELVENLEEYDNEMGKKSMVLIEPPSIDQRIINQSGKKD